MSGLFKVGRTLKIENADDDNALQEVATKVENMFGVGSSAPSGNTAGSVYLQYDSSDTTAALTVYVKIGSDWYGA